MKSRHKADLSLCSKSCRPLNEHFMEHYRDLNSKKNKRTNNFSYGISKCNQFKEKEEGKKREEDKRKKK